MSGSENYPEQRHAGKIGYGPNYNTGASVVDNLHGLAFEVWGKLTHNSDRVRRGHEIFTGELKRKKLLGDMDSNSVIKSDSHKGGKSPTDSVTDNPHPNVPTPVETSGPYSENPSLATPAGGSVKI